MNRVAPDAGRADGVDGLTALADWRRRIGDLYADVRSTSGADVQAAWRRWVEVRESLFREHAQSPLPPTERDAFRARHWPYDPALRFHVGVTRAEPDRPAAAAEAGSRLALPTSDGATMAFERIGWLDVPFAAGSRRLALCWMAGYAGGLFLPFRDATNGTATYGAGRYLLDAAKGADLGADGDGRLILDFNFAFQPSCAFDARWACPLAPPENRLDIPIRGGERNA